MAEFTIDSLIAHYKLQPSMLDGECSKEHVQEIGKTIDWRAVGQYLLSDVELGDIDIDGHNEGLKRTNMLNKWKEKKSFMATYSKLIEAMLKAGKGDQANGVCKLLQRTSSSGAQPTASASQGARHSKKGEKPDLDSLLEFKGKKETFNVAQRISTNYGIFGVLLLKDKDGTVMSEIEDRYPGRATRINREILQQWLQGKGKSPVTWGTLIDVLELESIKLNVLAQDMREALGF